MTTFLLSTFGVVAILVIAAVFRTLAFPLVSRPASPSSHDDEAARACALRLEADVRAVASRPHNLAHPGSLERAAAHIETRISQFGLEAEPQQFKVGDTLVRNIEIIFEPQSPASNRGTIVIGAHYDSDGDSPGANDNGTGVAALLEVARRLSVNRPNLERRLRLVFFVNEEQPYGKTEDMGSLRHARRLAICGEAVEGMIALETIGFFSGKPGSQRLPFPFDRIYPDTGNFVAFVGLPGSGRFLRRALSKFRETNAYASTGTIVPAFIEGADLSDHWAYHEVGYPALMVTDTATYRNPFYHSIGDLPETVDYISLARIVDGLDVMIRRLVAT